MDFRLTKEEALFQKMCREFALNEVEPIAAEIDAEERYPEETVQKLMKYGLMGIQFPKEVGGSGGNYVCYTIAIEEMSRVCATTGAIISAHGTLGAWPIYAFGTPEQKEKWLRPLIEPKEGAKLGAFGLTEPNAGTDSAAQQTVAVKQEDGSYIMNGSKVFITGGGRADTYVVFAMTDKSKGNKGISAFIVDKDDPGFSIGKIEHKMGIRGSQTSELIFEDVHLPADRLLGKENGGFKIAMMTLDGGRIGIAAQALGIAQGALDKAVQYMKERVQFGKTLDKFQGLQWMVADMATQIDAARLLVRRYGRYHQVRTDLRRLRLHPRVPDGAHDARRKDHRDLRGHFSGSENGHRRSGTALRKGGKLNYESNRLCKAGSGYLRQGSSQSRRHPEPCIYGNHHQPGRPERS